MRIAPKSARNPLLLVRSIAAFVFVAATASIVAFVDRVLGPDNEDVEVRSR